MRSIEFNGQIIEYTLTRKKVKNINLRIKANGEVCVSAPRSVPAGVIEDFVRRNAGRILAAGKRFAAAQKEMPKLEDGGFIYLSGRKYPLNVRHGERNHYVLNNSEITFYTSDLSSQAICRMLYDKLLYDMAKQTFERIAAECLPLFPQKALDPPLIRIRKMKSQWGNCRAAKNIVTLNSRLAAYDQSVIKFVICHEFCHFIHQDHSKAFYDSLSSVMPQWKEYDALLKNKLIYC